MNAYNVGHLGNARPLKTAGNLDNRWTVVPRHVINKFPFITWCKNHDKTCLQDAKIETMPGIWCALHERSRNYTNSNWIVITF